jgi:hypothetical protein
LSALQEYEQPSDEELRGAYDALHLEARVALEDSKSLLSQLRLEQAKLVCRVKIFGEDDLSAEEKNDLKTLPDYIASADDEVKSWQTRLETIENYGNL